MTFQFLLLLLLLLISYCMQWIVVCIFIRFMLWIHSSVRWNVKRSKICGKFILTRSMMMMMMMMMMKNPTSINSFVIYHQGIIHPKLSRNNNLPKQQQQQQQQNRWVVRGHLNHHHHYHHHLSQQTTFHNNENEFHRKNHSSRFVTKEVSSTVIVPSLWKEDSLCRYPPLDCPSVSLSSSMSRRKILWQGMTSVTTGLVACNIFPTISDASTIVTTAAVCDPTVSVWSLASRSTSDNTIINERVVHLLGTAHISSVSAELAGQLVHDAHPNAVFVELDLKRVGGVSKTTTQQPQQQQQLQLVVRAGSDDGTDETDTLQRPTRIVIPRISAVSSNSDEEHIMNPSSSGSVTALSESPDTESKQLQRPPPPPPAAPTIGGGLFRVVRQRAMNFASAAVGSALKSMYQNLGTAGFNPGEEFVAAIKEGRKVGADIVLGDQDVDITLRRLTEALSQTDLNKLVGTDTELDRSMSELFPSPSGRPDNVDAKDAAKAELAEYIEKLKSRENVRRIMAQLNEVAPALVQAMLTERDAFMAAGIDTLNQYECIVAVMGIAHMDGVEANLRARGWNQVSLSAQCSKYNGI